MREAIIEQLTARVAAIRGDQPVRVALDGIDAAGKTTLADELAVALVRTGRQLIRASVDGFHLPRAVRYGRFGAPSPEGCYEDTFDYPAVWAALLGPLGPGGDRRYRCAAFDAERDAPLPEAWLTATDDAILVFDGVFAFRPELDAAWDYRILVQVGEETALARALVRDLARFGSAETVRERYARRYFPAQAKYRALVVNDDPACPVLRWREDLRVPEQG